MNDWYQNGHLPHSCDDDTAYFLKLQKERLAQKSLRVVNDIYPVKGKSYGTATVSEKSVWYTIDMVYEEISRKLAFVYECETLYEREIWQTMYGIVVHSPNEHEVEKMMLTCPNCGAVSPVSQLTQGCHSCGTQFHIKELFPRITNTFFVKNTSIDNTQKMMHLIFGISMGTILLLFVPMSFISNGQNLPLALLTGYMIALPYGGIIGLVLTAIILIVSLFHQDGKRIPLIAAWMSRNKIKKE